jgi:hypothetical protein
MISVSSFNVKNLKANHSMVKSLLEKSHICYLIEHWCSKEDEHLIKSLTNKKQKTLFESEFLDVEYRRGRPFGGTCWVIDSSFEVLNYRYFTRHLSLIEIKEPLGAIMIVIGVWLPFDDSRLETWAKIETLYSEIESLLTNLKDKPCLIIGDWNADPKRGKRSDQRFTELCEQNDLICCEYKFIQNTNHPYRNGDYIA